MLRAQSWERIAKVLPPPSNTEYQKFGYSISISGDVAIVGSEETQAAFVLEFNGSTWDHVATLTATDAGSFDGFGQSVAITDDAAFVGAPQKEVSSTENGAVYVYEKPGGGWANMTQSARYVESGPSFGISLSVSDDVLAVGASGYSSNRGRVYIFEKKSWGWGYLSASAALNAPDAASGDKLGTSVSISGDVVLAGAAQNGTGVAYVFEKPSLGWVNLTVASVLTPSDASQLFGFSVSLSGDVALVGAYGDDTNGTNSGSAFVFEKGGGGWADMTETAKLTPSDAAADDLFGFSVSLSGDVALIGSPQHPNSTNQEGASYLFEKPGGGWVTGTETAQFTTSDNDQEDNFGIALGISGERVLVGAHQDDESGVDAGAAYYFEKPGGGWASATEDQKILPQEGTARGDNFSYDLAMDGTTAVVGAPLNDQDVDAGGVAYVLELSDGTWNRVATLSSSEILITGASSRVGWKVDISGDVAVVGSAGAGAYVFEKPGGGWTDMTETAILGITGSNDVAIDGDIVVVAETSNSGELLLFEKPGGGWVDMDATDTLTNSDGSEFRSVSMSGDVVAAGTPLLSSEQGAAYVFEKPGGGWTNASETAKLTSSDIMNGDRFGYSVAIEGTIVVVGAYLDNLGVANAGSVYLFEKPGGGWATATQDAKFTNYVGEAAEFGSSVDISGDWVLVGAPSEDELGSDNGAAYLFEKPMSGWTDATAGDVQIRIGHEFNGDRYGHSVAISGNRLLVGTATYDEAGLDAGAAFYYSSSETPTTSNITDLSATEDGSDVSVDLYDAFDDAEDPDTDLQFEIDVSKPSYFSNISFVPPDLTFSLAADAFGTSQVTIEAFDTDGKSVKDIFNVVIDPVPDDPSINDLAMTYGDQLEGGFVITPNPVDISSITHYKITSISGGSLYLNNTSSPVSDGDFISDGTTTALKFTPGGAGNGGFTIQASVSGDDSGLGGNTVSTTVTIAKAQLTAAADDLAKTYGEVNPSLTVSYTGFVVGDDATLDNATDLDEEPSASTTATQFSDVGDYDISLTGGSDNNYDLTLEDGTLTIQKAQLDATPDDLEKEYGDPNPTLTLSYDGFVGSDDADDINTPPSVSTSATQFSITGSYDIDATGGSDDNYNINIVTNGTLTVNQAPLTLTADDQMTPYGGPIPALTYTYSGFKGTDDESDIDTPPFLSVNANQFSPVGDYPITLNSGGGDFNYSISFSEGTLSISKKALTATADDKIFGLGQPLPELTITYTGFANGETAGVLDTPPAISTTATATSPAGEYPITLMGGTDNNYDLVLVNGTMTVTGELTLTVEATDVTITYGDAIPELSFTYSGFVDDDGPDDVDIEPIISTAAIQFGEAGEYTIALTGGSDDRYQLNRVNGTLTVNKALLTATADNKLVGLGQPFPEFTIAYSGFLGEDDEADLDMEPLAVPNANVGSPAGNYSITVAGGSDNNYTYSYVSGTLTILQNPVLNVSVESQTIEYGNAIPDFTLTYSGFIGADNVSVINVLPSATTGASPFSGAGTYPINLSGGSDDLYVFQYGTATLTIEKAPLQATADDISRAFGEADPEFTITYSGFKGSDAAPNIDVPPSASTMATIESDVGDYEIILEGGSDDNYIISLVSGLLTITQAEATITLGDLDQVADGSPKEVTVTTEPEGLTVDVTYDGGDSPPVEPGEYAVVAEIAELNYTGSASGTLILSEEGVTGLGRIPAEMVKVYPNPVREHLIVENGTQTEEFESLRIMRVDGSQVLVRPLSLNWKTIDIDFTELSSGIYLLWLRTKDNTYLYQEIVKVR